VSRHPWPPYDFVCIYEHTCPYLDGLSTVWVLGQYRRADDVYHEHLRIIDNYSDALKASEDRVRALERENAELKAKLKALHQKQFKPNRKQGSEAVAAKESPEGKRKKKRGAPVGHPAWTRPKPDHIDRTVFVDAPKVCPHCHSTKLTQTDGVHEHLQEDIVIRPRTVVTRYLHQEAFCSCCNRPVVQAGPDELPNAYIGPLAKSAAVYLRYGIGISYRKISMLFRVLFGLNFVPASAVGFDRKAAKKGKPLYNDLLEKIRASDVVNADETSWRNDGLGHWVWFLGNKQLAYFHIDRHRSAEVAKSLFGDFDGTVVRDRYAAYNGIGADWQSCLAHIGAKAKEIGKEHALLPPPEQDRFVETFVNDVRDFCKRACDIGQKLKAGEIPWKETTDIEKRFVAELNVICKRQLSFKPAETLRKCLSGPEQKALLTFLRVPGVPPTNNLAEQAQRHMVLFRKLSFGTRSDSGLETHSILPSLVQTARRQGVDPREFLHILLTADADTAKTALYNNSS